MTFLNKKMKFISIFLTIAFFNTLFSINLASATSLALPGSIDGIPTSDYIVQHNTWVIANTLAGTPVIGLDKDTNPLSANNWMKMALKRLLREITKVTVTWINSGFNGNPSFITNTGGFLRDTADIAIGDMIMGTELDFLCDPFKLQVKLALGLQYRPFKEQIKCTLSGVLENINKAGNDFVNGDFIGGGGWNTWLEMTTQPQNNQMGAMILAQGEMDARIEAKKGEATMEANWGGGFMSWKDCPTVSVTEDSSTADINTAWDENNRIRSYAAVTGQKRGDDGCVIKTPGGVIANKINWMDTSTIRELELANDFNEIINALGNQLLTMGMSSISGSGLLGNIIPKPSSAAADNQAYLARLQQQLASQPNTGNTSGNTTFGGTASGNTSNPFINQTFTSQTSALSTIDSQITIESNYLLAQVNINNLLNNTQNIFNSSFCDQTTVTGINNQITGDYVGVRDLIWNKKDIATVSSSTQNNISTLISIRSSVAVSTNDSYIDSLIQPLDTLPTHSATNGVDSVASFSSGGDYYESIKNWIQNKINTNRTCVGNVSALSSWGIQ